MSRRTVCRAATAAVTGLGAALLSGCAAAQRPKPGPQVASSVTRLSFTPWYTGVGWQTVQPLFSEVLASFEAANPGLQVVLQNAPGGCCSPSALAVAIVGGSGADVVLNNNFGPLAEAGYLLALDPYLSRDNIDKTIWSKLQMASFQSRGSLYALPTYCNTSAYCVNQSTFDTLGLDYPDPRWTSGEFLTAAQSLTGTSGGEHRYGCNLWWWTDQAWGSDWIFHGFGGAKVEPGGTRCGLNSTASLAAGAWIYEQILWPGVGTCQDTLGGYAQQFATGQTAMSVQQTGTLAAAVTALASKGIKWDLYPFPSFPAGPAAFGGDQFYAINATSPHPEETWTLLRWICAESVWQKAMISMFLMAPALVALWPEWISTVTAVAPPLKGKDLQAFSAPAVGGYAIPSAYFRYSDAQAETIIQTAYAALYGRQQTSVVTAFAQAAAEVDDLEAAGSTRAAAAEAASAAFPTTGPAMSPVPAGV